MCYPLSPPRHLTMSPCPQKELCGSCSWSHIPYDKQLQQKLSDINGSFALKELDFTCDKIVASPKTEHYRNRMDFVIDFEGRVGMRETRKWWKVIDNHTCFLADEKIDETFSRVRDWVKTSGLSFYDRKSHEGFLRYAVIRSTTLGETMVNLVTSAPVKDEEWLDQSSATQPGCVHGNQVALPLFPPCTSLMWSINDTMTDVSFGSDIRTLAGSNTIEESIGGIRYRISPNAFFQTNSYAAPLLLKTVEEFTGDMVNKTLLDLYCGTGFFAVALANKTKRTVGVEMVDEAIHDAVENAKLNNVDVEFHVAKTEDFNWAEYNADIAILDPPRSGMHDTALADVLRILPKEIIYVSCNPKNFAREMVQLQKHYRVERMRAIDMFPHTPHVELVTKLKRK